MSIPVTCPYCGATGRLRDDASGQRVLCPRCGMRFELPAQLRPEPDLPAAVIVTEDRPAAQGGGAAAQDDFGNPALSGFYESPSVDADLNSGEGPILARRTVLAIRGTRAWGDWLASISKLSGQPAAMLVETALAEWAARHNLPAPPKR